MARFIVLALALFSGSTMVSGAGLRSGGRALSAMELAEDPLPVAVAPEVEKKIPPPTHQREIKIKRSLLMGASGGARRERVCVMWGRIFFFLKPLFLLLKLWNTQIFFSHTES